MRGDTATDFANEHLATPRPVWVAKPCATELRGNNWYGGAIDLPDIRPLPPIIRGSKFCLPESGWGELSNRYFLAEAFRKIDIIFSRATASIC